VEEQSLSIDLTFGQSLMTLAGLLEEMLKRERIRGVYRNKMLPTVLHGYLSLRKLMLQRTKHIEDTQNIFSKIIEELTAGTEEDVLHLMRACVDTAADFPAADLRTPVYIFERLAAIMAPEQRQVKEFAISIEKDAQQDDYLQGRMTGNPYNSEGAGLGPLMRDIKKKICRDSELYSLLESDDTIELLVDNKIMSLDLAVADIYKLLWQPKYPDNKEMRIVYRMRGLLGDATEEFVETLESKKTSEEDDERTYRRAAVMAQCGGLKVMLECLQRAADLSCGKQLLFVLLKLFSLCLKLKVNRLAMLSPELGAISVLLHTLKQCLAAEPDCVEGSPGQASLTEQLLSVMETVLVQGSTLSPHEYQALIEGGGTLEDIHLLLNYVSTCSTTKAHIKQRLMRVLPFLVFCHKEKMELLVGHFRAVLDFDALDSSHSAEHAAKMESFCDFCTGIERNQIGNQLKDIILRANIVEDALSYLRRHVPQSSKIVVALDQEWRDFIARPSLRYILLLLTGLATKHVATQRAIALDSVQAIHKLEQISSDEHLGSLAENLLGALKDGEAKEQVSSVRTATRQEKKRLAMKNRVKELAKLGLKANDQLQITSQSSLLKQQMTELTEEKGIVCAICLDGYRSSPQKVLAIYTYSRKKPVDDFESGSSKTYGYSTVSHFNVVHVECHLSAVKSTRSRDEWESAALHNANTLTNGLLPLWGAHVPENAFVSCLARHNIYLQESTTHRDINFMFAVHDLKLLLLKFANEASFSEECGGGGPQSNLNLVPHLLHLALYVINTTRVMGREAGRVSEFLLSPDAAHWRESCFAADGPHFFAVLALAVSGAMKWGTQLRIAALQRLLACAHTRAHPKGASLSRAAKPWPVYKPACLFWCMLDQLFTVMFAAVPGSAEWSCSLADYIRHHDVPLLDASAKILNKYQTELQPCASFAEFCDVAELLGTIANPDTFLSDLLARLG